MDGEQIVFTLDIETRHEEELDNIDRKLQKVNNTIKSLESRKEKTLFSGLQSIKEIEKVEQALKVLFKQVTALEKERIQIPITLPKQLDKEFNAMATQIRQLKKAMSASGEQTEIDRYKQQIAELIVKMQEVGKKRKLIHTDPSSAAEIKDIDNQILKLRQDAENLLNKKYKLQFSEKESEQELKRITLELKELEAQRKKISSNKESLLNASQLTKIGNAIKNIHSTIAGIAPGFNALSGALQGIGQSLLNVGAAAVKEAVEWEILRMKLDNFYTTAAEANMVFDKLVQMAKTTPFEIKGLVQAAVMLKSFGLDVEKTIVLSGNLAATMGGDVKDAGYAVARALSGASLGFLMLQRSWGVSYAKLRAMGAEFMAGNRLMASSEKTQQALVKVLEKYNGAMERMSSTVQGRLSNLKDAFDTLKAAAASELLPVLSKLVVMSTDFINIFNELPTFVKTGAVALTLLGGVAANVAAAIFGIVARLDQFGQGLAMLGSLQIMQKATSAVVVSENVKMASSIVATNAAIRATGTTMGVVAKQAGFWSAGISAFGLGIAGIAGIATMALMHVLTSLQNDANKKVFDEVEESVKRLTEGVNELGLSFGGSQSKMDIFRQALAQTNEQIIGMTNNIYQYEGKMPELFARTEEEIIKEQEDLVKSAEAHGKQFAMLAEEAQQKIDQIQSRETGSYARPLFEDEKAQIQDLQAEYTKYATMANQYLGTEMANGHKYLGIVGEIQKKYREALRERQEMEGQYEQLLTDEQEISKYVLKENLNGLASRKEVIEEILKIEGLSNNARLQWLGEYAEVEKKLNKLTVEDAKTQYKAYVDGIQKIAKTGGDNTQLFVKYAFRAVTDFGKNLVAAMDNGKEFERQWGEYVTSQKKALAEGDITEKEYYASLKKYREDHINQLKGSAKVQKQIDSEIATHGKKAAIEGWDTFEKEQSIKLKNSQITYQQYVQSLQGYYDQNINEIKQYGDLELQIRNKIATANNKIQKMAAKDLLKIRLDTLEAMGHVEEARVQKSLLSLKEEYNENVKNYGYSLDLYKSYIAQKELIYKEHNDRMRDATIKMQADILKASTDRFEKADYITGINDLNKQREEYEQLGKSKEEVDLWYDKMKRQLDDKYLNDVYQNNLALFKNHQELYNKILELEHSRLTNQLTGNAALKEETDYLASQISIIQQRVDKEANMGETLKLRLLAGQELKGTEQDILNTYLEDVKALELMKQSQDDLLKKSVEMFDSSLEAMKSYYGILVAQGKMTQDQMDKIVSSFTVDYARSWNEYIQPILEKAKAGGGIHVLAPDEQEALNTFFNTIQTKGKDAAQTLADMGIVIDTASMGLVTFGQELYNTGQEADKAADSTQKLGDTANDALNATSNAANKAADSMGNLATSTQNATDAMVQYGNVSAKTLDQKTGNFMTPEQAFSNLPGAGKPPPIGDATGGGSYGRISYDNKATPGLVYGPNMADALNPGQSYRPGNSPSSDSRRPFGYDSKVNDSMANTEGRKFIERTIGKSSADAIFNFMQGTVDEMRGLGGSLAQRLLSNIPGQGTATGFTAPATPAGPSQYSKPIEYLHDATNLFDLDGLEKYMKMTDAMIDLREKDTSKLLEQYEVNLKNMELLQEINSTKATTEEQAAYIEEANLIEKQKFITEENNALKENVEIIQQKVKTEGIARLTDAESQLLSVYLEQVTTLKDMETRLKEIQDLRNASSAPTLTGIETVTGEGTGEGDGAGTTIAAVPRIAPSGRNATATQQIIMDNLSSTQGEFKNITDSMAKYLKAIFGKLPSFVETVNGQRVGGTSAPSIQQNTSYTANFGGTGYPAPQGMRPALQTIGSYSAEMALKFGTR